MMELNLRCGGKWQKKLPEVKPGAYLLLVGRVLILGCNEV